MRASADRSVLSRLGEHAIDGRSRYAKRGRNRPRRFTGGMHPPRQGHLGIVERLRATDGLTACPPCVPRCRAALLAEF
jgi:hypothetical protein